MTSTFHLSAFSTQDVDQRSTEAEDVVQFQRKTSGNDSGHLERKRRPACTAERRATHNAIERARHETLNSLFLVKIHFLSCMLLCFADPRYPGAGGSTPKPQ